MEKLDALSTWNLDAVYPESYSPHSEPVIKFSEENFLKLIESHNRVVETLNELIDAQED